MTHEARCLKMMKLERYRKDLQNANRNELIHTFLLSSVACCIVSCLAKDKQSEIEALCTYLGITGTPFLLTNLIRSICTKTNLESKINDLELDLEFADNAPKGKRL